MKKLLKFAALGLAFVAVAAVGRAMVVKYNAYLVNEAGLTYNNTYPIPLNSYAIDNLAFTSIASSVTFANETFTDGQASTGSITVVSNTVLSTAAAADYLTVLSTVIVAGSSIVVNGIPLFSGSEFVPVNTTSMTALAISAAINLNIPGVISSTGPSSVVYTSAAVVGSYGNSMTLVSWTSSVTANAASFTGGRDAALITIGNTEYAAGVDYTVGATAGATATNIATAITASSATSKVTAGALGTLVTATSTVVGAFTNYVITSSTQAALKIGGSTVTVQGLNGRGIGRMWGGTDPAYTLVSGSATVVTIANNAYPLALPVLYTTTSGQAIGGLTSLTTYYVIPVTPNSVGFALTSTGAIAGKFIVLTSSQIKTTADVFTLSALAITGTPSYKWQASNDGVNWFDYQTTSENVSVSSVTLNTYVSTGTYSAWDFGNYGYAWIRLNVTSPTAGAIKLQVEGNGKNTSN